MATTISGMISFSGFLGDTRFTEPAPGRKARLSIRVYDRHSWKDAQGNRQQAANYDSITVVYWGRTAQAIHQLIADRTISQKDPVTGTGYLDDEPDTWIGRDDQQPHARIRVDGRSLCPDPLRQSFIDQANSRKQAPAAQNAPAYNRQAPGNAQRPAAQQQAPAESWPKTARPGAPVLAQQQPAQAQPAQAPAQQQQAPAQQAPALAQPAQAPAQQQQAPAAANGPAGAQPDWMK